MKKREHSIHLSGLTKSVIKVLSALILSSEAQSALTVTVAGDAEGSGSVWTFNGTTEVGITATLFSLGGNTSINNFSHASGALNGEYVSNTNYNDAISIGHTITGGSVSGSSSGSFSFDGLFLDSDGAVGGDDFAWLIGNQAFHGFVDGEVLSFDNYTLQTNLDIMTFGEGINAISSNGDNFKVSSSTQAIGDLSLSFTAQSNVPEPSSGILFLLGVSVCALWRRRACSQ